MKKTYGKPDIVFDNFSMCSSIAWCAEPVGAFRGTCGKKITSTITIFASAASGIGESVCNVDVDTKYNINIETDAYDGWCYHVPTEDGSLFHS